MAIMDVDSPIEEPRIQLNPGSNYLLKKTDFCFYMSVSKEENTHLSRIKMERHELSQREKNYG